MTQGCERGSQLSTTVRRDKETSLLTLLLTPPENLLSAAVAALGYSHMLLGSYYNGRGPGDTHPQAVLGRLQARRGSSHMGGRGG